MADDTAPPEPIDTTNKYLVAMRGDDLVFLRRVPQQISQQDALLLAAYLVSMVGDDDLWTRTLDAVQNA